jgi:2-dehydro-3-deoxyphosphooctonate aldolase (KDO 8-P synthase)
MVEKTLDRIARGQFFLIAGPCVIESEEVCFRVAEHVTALAERLNLPYVFKASYKKANRLSAGSYSGPGLDDGLAVLRKVKDRFEIPILTDVHETVEVDAAAEVVDVLQIPAFLCRQTELVVKAAKTGRWVNIKKGQFLAPEDMAKVAAKAGTRKVMLTERGTTFGYRNLVVDFRSLLIMKETGLPVIFDATHSLQLPGGGGSVSTGQPEYIIPMARAAAAVGVDGLFVETHPEPVRALSDAGAMLPMEKMAELLRSVLRIRETADKGQ